MHIQNKMQESSSDGAVHRGRLADITAGPQTTRGTNVHQERTVLTSVLLYVRVLWYCCMRTAGISALCALRLQQYCCRQREQQVLLYGRIQTVCMRVTYEHPSHGYTVEKMIRILQQQHTWYNYCGC